MGVRTSEDRYSGQNLAVFNQIHRHVPYDQASHLLSMHSNKFFHGPVRGYVWEYLL